MATLLDKAIDSTPIVPSDISFKDNDPFWIGLRDTLNQKMQSMETYRYSWWQHWARLAEFILPRRYHWLVIANRTDRGFPINGNIVDATGTVAARTLASGLMSGLTSPTRPWFRVGIPDPDLMEHTAVKEWCDEVQRRMLKVMAKSNFYDSFGIMYFDLTVFGTAPVIIYEDDKTVIRCFNPCAGEYYLAVDGTFRVCDLARKFTCTINQLADMFGVDALTDQMRADLKIGGAGAQRELVVAHMIEVNKPVTVDDMPERYPVLKKFKYREVYWIFAGDTPSPLACRGFDDDPFIAPRWDVTSNDPYGRSACMDALPDIMQLQLEQKAKAKGILKQVNPPLLADVTLKNEPTSAVEGGITYVANLSSSNGMKPVYTVNPDLSAITVDIKEIQERIKTILFNDLFLMISQLETVRTATEIDARREEKLIQLGPVIERLQGEGLDTAIKRIYNVMVKRRLLPKPPAEIQGLPIQIEYISTLAEAQRAIGTAAIERLFQFAGNMAGVFPSIGDNLDADEAIDEYADLLHVPARLIRDKRKVDFLRQARAKQQQQSELLQQTIAGAKGAKDLSDTEVGGGRNALQMIMGQ